MNVILKVQDTRIKHTNGENINISVAMLGKKFNELTNRDIKEQESIE